MRELTIHVPRAGRSGVLHEIGAVACLMSAHQEYSTFPLASIKHWIEPALQVDQLAVFYARNNPVGYITWAFLAPDVEERWINDAYAMLHYSEWNEGENCWVMDFFAKGNYCHDVLYYARDRLFANLDIVRSLRRNPDGSIRKISQWKSRTKA